MKKIALISTYCNTVEKINILKENIDILKSLGLDTLVISPLYLPETIIESSDFVFFTKENPLLFWPLRSFTFWKSIKTSQGNFIMHHNLADYGWAALYQIKKMSEIALSYDYDYFYHIIYDTEIDDELQKEIVRNDVNLIHTRVNPNNPHEIWEATLHFMVFDRETMKNVVNRINFNDYLKSNGVAEGQALKWAEEIPLKISDYPVKDKIYYWEDKDFFNYLNTKKFKLFFSKNDNSEIWTTNPVTLGFVNDKLKLLFYDVNIPTTIKILVNDYEEIVEIIENKLLEIDYPSSQVKKFIIQDGENIYDLLDDYKNTNRNVIYYDNVPFDINYGNEIRVESSNLEINYNSNNLPLKVVFQRQIGNKHLWESNLNSYSWVTFPNTEMVDTLIYDKNNTLIYRHNWNVENNGTFIYKKLFEYCFNNFQNGIQNNGIVVGTHNGEFGEWVPIATKKLSKILLIEASKSQFDDLVKNFNWNQELRFMNELITVDGEDTIFYEGGQGYTNTILKRVIEYWEKEPITETRMKSIKFSDIVSEDINWIHMDVEGIDYQLIMSLTDKQLNQLGIIIYEYNNSTPNERILIENFLKSKGFQTYNEDGVGMGYKL